MKYLIIFLLFSITIFLLLTSYFNAENLYKTNMEQTVYNIYRHFKCK